MLSESFETLHPDATYMLRYSTSDTCQHDYKIKPLQKLIFMPRPLLFRNRHGLQAQDGGHG